MITITREVFKVDPYYAALWAIIKSRHIVAEHTKKTLLENRHIQGFCESSRTFAVCPKEKLVKDESGLIYLHYDVSSWYFERNPENVLVKVEEMGIYDSYMEYESQRLKQLHGSTKGADIPNIN